MYVKVRSMDGLETTVLNISKLTNVEDLRMLVQDKYNVPPERQRLFYRGKQMEDGHKLFDYSVNVNDVIQLMVKPILNEVTNKTKERDSKEKSSKSRKHLSNKENCENSEESPPPLKSLYYEEGDLVDAKCLYDGTWWEGKITRIAPNANCKKTDTDDGLFYYIKFERYTDFPEDELKLEHIRPRARIKIPLDDLKIGDHVMVNYNLESPEERGFWYDCQVTNIINNEEKKIVVGTLTITGNSQEKTVEECYIHLVEEIFKIEKHVPLTIRHVDGCPSSDTVPAKRESGPNCTTCRDNPRRKCNDCGCAKCGGKESPDMQLMCDECDQPYHIFCLDPPLDKIPDVEEWFCPECKNDESEIVRAGERLKESKKRAKLASSKSSTHRDWGKGFACAGRQKVCTLVPQDHFGPVPGVEVGTLWKFRLQVSEAGIHRPHVAGIHGRESQGAYSLVLAGGYEDDEDRGEEFTYTGSGGRDLSGNKRTAEQSCDQALTRMNKALALNCNTPINAGGGTAKDWKKGKPVRVVRNYKGRKHSSFAPEEGNRYDGIYKIVKYWQAVGKSGYMVWRYLLRRDDPSSPPWTNEGKKKSKELGLTLQYPEGYLEAMKEKKGSSVSSDEEEVRPKKRGRKRTVPVETEETSESPSLKRRRASVEYKIDNQLIKLIEKDKANEKIWQECQLSAKEGKVSFVSAVEERFVCVCCQSLVHLPVTTPCGHNVCQSCVERSFIAEVFSCPSCRYDLGRDFKSNVNKSLRQALDSIFPGYGAGR